jgi:hypothetical protein
MQKTRVRPDPVSCESCRSKKLKCNRVQPCSNCSARGITCRFLVKPQKAQPVVVSNEYLLNRLEKLEKTVISLEQQLRASNESPNFPSTTSHHVRSGHSILQESYQVDSPDTSLENIGVRNDELVCSQQGKVRPIIRWPNVTNVESSAICLNRYITKSDHFQKL